MTDSPGILLERERDELYSLQRENVARKLMLDNNYQYL